MRHAIDPKIDCVFKALLGAEANRGLLVHFLNAMLGAELRAPIVDVVILNHYKERKFLDDKLSIVDVKARDASCCLYQIEIALPRPKIGGAGVAARAALSAGCGRRAVHLEANREPRCKRSSSRPKFKMASCACQRTRNWRKDGLCVSS
jgi:hypothetical protein